MSFGFGSATPQTAFGTSTFNNPATSSSSFTFGTAAPVAPTTATSFSFGVAPSTQGGFQIGTSTVAPTQGGFSAGTPAFNLSSTPLGFGGATATSSSALGGSGSAGVFGVGAASIAPTSSGLLANAVTTAVTPTPSLGLGGVNSTPFGGDLSVSTAQDKTDSKAFNEMPVPSEIDLSVEEFKKHVKEQKAKKDEVSRGSSKAPEKVGEEAESLKNILSVLANNIQQHSALVHKLKHDAAHEIKNAEIAQRTKETVPGLQLDNTAPLEYFLRLVADFEQRMQFYKQQIEDTERNLLAMSKQHSLTPQELMGTMKKLHESFVLLAGRVTAIHTALQNYKDDYLTFRRRALGSSVDIFSSKSHAKMNTPVVNQLHHVGSGPSPFGGSSDPLSRTLTHLSGTVQQTSGPNPVNFSSSLANGGNLPNSSNPHAFGTPGRLPGFGGPAQNLLQTNPIQLQSPPPGNKRNKR